MFFFVKVNQRVINVFYPSFKMRVKVVSINMKTGTLKIAFLAISQNTFDKDLKKILLERNIYFYLNFKINILFIKHINHYLLHV